MLSATQTPPRPRIGITTSLNPTESGALEQRLDLAYVRAVERAGGLPLLVPMLETDEAADAFAALLDGLVVTGGPAVTDGLVGALPDDIDETHPARTASDVRLLRAFLDARRPALGVCYGMQLASALRGGTIYADVQRDADADIHSSGRGGTTHPVAVEPGTRLHALVGGAVDVNTRHVQAVAEPGAGLVVSARAPDGTVEAIETADGTFVGLQFHPEAMSPPLDAVFEDLVARARAGRENRAGIGL
ncbi:gamma-glutamyl-gamma-aminobutyrate hydrolase family protein [Rubrivirga sp. S365]|uniref:Gamma-glutamyl-gamma-aminobutyrate hydrolase family protein n=1 Tax=Rubrivirga litoralis TaxID=3075598 RepID=A0ABU3BTY4_9BACT|nr:MULTISPECIES: gamma-glutamyl-gamma-aminobutyrate hydrolase family protein [unclassified Rubrivirga]MDT0632754.1 gamma-glutamyl-gamma-aminobutyrate hydrolase family protein [Rubrivirga sp. F394]MDT7856941.1 gamma-glutamyl-gamma-aminobutyrate hydrolase family protein [Rubrivirga sp. S365]